MQGDDSENGYYGSVSSPEQTQFGGSIEQANWLDSAKDWNRISKSVKYSSFKS